ncbi:hypothetical protein HYPSUDRAFT_60003 [Hypholoma sublateritium FD-334 SS-4]|uniref:Uncharacterized protein n=1 Tax=Hypholoma sublateritium (strain FD-334 SS-4) TaxID=945553 RepID=A0A0D2N220_HYPSF|nr:hypothetical protein HYPSUDRAFT_60003 [Hypholoma sublateritium FD-334 SS-4]
MKLAFSVCSLSVALIWLFPGVLGHPIDGHASTSIRDNSFGGVTGSLEERALIKKFPMLSSSPFKSKPVSEKEAADKKLRAQWKAQAALRRAQDKHDSTMAKIANGGGANHRVATAYKPGAGGEAELGSIAHAQAQKHWQNSPQLQKFTHAEVSAKVHTDGRVWTTARYHNGGGRFSGSTEHIFSDAPKAANASKSPRKKVLGLF